MKVGIIGSGVVGQTLGAGFAALGHQVKVSSRDPAKLNQWARQTGPNASTGDFAQAAQFGELLVVATLGSKTRNALELAGTGHFGGKVVIDTTNPLAFPPGGLPTLYLGHTDSLGEEVQRWLPTAHVVKAFNTVGNGQMFKPSFAGGPPTMFICGNDAGAKATVAKLLSDFGWESADVGGIESSRELEPMCLLWVKYALLNGMRWDHAFKLLKK